MLPGPRRGPLLSSRAARACIDNACLLVCNMVSAMCRSLSAVTPGLAASRTPCRSLQTPRATLRIAFAQKSCELFGIRILVLYKWFQRLVPPRSLSPQQEDSFGARHLRLQVILWRPRKWSTTLRKPLAKDWSVRVFTTNSSPRWARKCPQYLLSGQCSLA